MCFPFYCVIYIVSAPFISFHLRLEPAGSQTRGLKETQKTGPAPQKDTHRYNCDDVRRRKPSGPCDKCMHWIWTPLSLCCPILHGGLRLRSKIRRLTQDKNGIKRAQRCKITDQRAGRKKKNNTWIVNKLIRRQPPVLLDGPSVVGGGEKQTTCSWRGKRKWIFLRQHPIFQSGIQQHIKGCLCSKSVRFGINGLQRGLDRDTHARARAPTHKHVHKNTQNPPS